MDRVLVIGAGGSGKTTVSRRLAAMLHLPLIHLDAHYWRRGWVATPPDEWERVVRSLASQPRWIMDGNYGGTLELRLHACDTVVFLDLPRRVSLWRVIKRRLRFWRRTRPDVAAGCPERLSWEFIVWIWTYPKRRRSRILKSLGDVDARVIVLSSQAEIDRFLATFEATPNRRPARLTR